MMEARVIEYPRSSGLDYHHNSPLIGEIPTNDYTHFHRSIDQLRSLNERGILNTNHFQNVLIPASTSPIVVQASGVYSEIKISDDYQSSNKSGRRSDDLIESEQLSDEYQHKKDINMSGSNFRIIHSPQQYSITTSSVSPINANAQNTHQPQSNFATMENSPHADIQMKPKIFTSKADLQLHTQAHMREAKPYKCTQCSKSFANSSYLSQHTRIHLGIKPYRCEICQRKFTQLSHLQQHIRTHTGDKPYKCRNPGCVKAFSQLSNLQSHSRSHQTDKPYKCNSCYKCFADEPSLLEHIPKHKESKHLKTHICQYCGKSYTQETYLQKHMQKHAERTDKRPPITGGRGGSGGQVNQNNNQNNSNQNNSSNNNIAMNTAIPAIPNQEHPYWPKVSPDSAANISNEVITHQQQQQPHQQQQHHEFQLVNSHELQHHQRDESIEDLRQNGHLNGQLVLPPSSTPNGYDVQSKLTSNSAFTPINSMPPHLNIQHHQLAQRPSYIYDAISFQNKQVAQNSGNGFPNQLISLHQIRNYAHQPGGGIMTGEHLLGVSVGKDKG